LEVALDFDGSHLYYFSKKVINSDTKIDPIELYNIYMCVLTYIRHTTVQIVSQCIKSLTSCLKGSQGFFTKPTETLNIVLKNNVQMRNFRDFLHPFPLLIFVFIFYKPTFLSPKQKSHPLSFFPKKPISLNNS
jgi:uncharacterized membrane protein